MADTLDRPAFAADARAPASRRRAAAIAAGPAGLWRDLAWTAGSFAVILSLLFGLAPGQGPGAEVPRAHPALASLAE